MRHDFREWALHCAHRCTDSTSSVRDCDFASRSHKVQYCIGDDSAAGFCNGCAADSAGSHWRAAAVHANRDQHNEPCRNVERHRQRLQWRDLRNNLSEWALHCAIHGANPASSVRDCDFGSRFHKIQHRFGDDSPSDFCNGCTADSAGEHWSAAAVHGNPDQRYKHRRNVERHGQRLQWSNLRDDLREWALHRAIHRTNPTTSVRDGDFRGRSHKVGQRVGNDYPAGFCNCRTADSAGSHWSSAAVHGNRSQHHKHRRNVEHFRQRLQRCDLRDDLSEWALHCAIHSANPASSIRNCDFGSKFDKIRQRLGDDYPAGFCNGCAADSAGSHWSSAAVHGNRRQHNKHRGNVEHHR
jgi:hypothetical protein